MIKQSSAIEQFRALHESGCFVLPNPWDVGSAVYLEHLGFKALATTSAGYAFSKGWPDGPAFVPRDLMLAHISELVESLSLPVNADFQNGYADEPEDVAAPGRQTPSVHVLEIIKLTNHIEHPAAGFLRNIFRVVEHARNCRRRYSGSLGDFSHGMGH